MCRAPENCTRLMRCLDGILCNFRWASKGLRGVVAIFWLFLWCFWFVAFFFLGFYKGLIRVVGCFGSACEHCKTLASCLIDSEPNKYCNCGLRALRIWSSARNSLDWGIQQKLKPKIEPKILRCLSCRAYAHILLFIVFMVLWHSDAWWIEAVHRGGE